MKIFYRKIKDANDTNDNILSENRRANDINDNILSENRRANDFKEMEAGILSKEEYTNRYKK